MHNYFVEYKFKTGSENHYWFPLFISAANGVEAETIAKTFQTAIEEHHTLITKSRVQPVIEQLNEKPIRMRVQQELRGRVSILNVAVWKFTDITTIPELNFQEHMDLVEFDAEMAGHTIAEVVRNDGFPVRLYYANPDLDFKEFLLLNVVDPTNVDT